MRWVVGLAVVLGTTFASSHTHAADRTQPFKSLTGAFFALSVPNMAESVAWYSEKLGLGVILQVREGVEVTVLEGGGLTVELLQDPAARPPAWVGIARPELLHGFFKAGFVVRDFDKTIEELRARGVVFAYGPFPAQGVQRANVIIRDNAGNLIQIFSDR
jgi:catechol 2,3-dioxygenase-like lactoylglutathione lyase family enzyme